MPAILRIFLTKTVASTPHCGSYAFYDVVGVRRAGSATREYGSNGMWVCNIIPFRGWGYAGVAVAAGPQLISILANSTWSVWSDPGRMVSHGNSVGDGWASQIGTLVTVGRPNLKHQWVSHREHRFR